MTETVPVIDIANVETPESLAAIDTACREWGFFQAVNHGMDAAASAALTTAMRGFFSQPTEVKRRLSRTSDNPWGFYDQELTKNTRDWQEVYDFGPADDRHLVPQWPDWMPEFEPAVRNYSRYSAAAAGIASSRDPMRSSSTSATSCRSGRTTCTAPPCTGS